MYSNMCLKIVLCFALTVSIDGYVLKHYQVPLSSEGMSVEITVRNKGDEHHPVSTKTFKFDIYEKNHKVMVSMAEAPEGVPSVIPFRKTVPTLENRSSIRVGMCPRGTERHGGFCFPSDDA